MILWLVLFKLFSMDNVLLSKGTQKPACDCSISLKKCSQNLSEYLYYKSLILAKRLHCWSMWNSCTKSPPFKKSLRIVAFWQMPKVHPNFFLFVITLGTAAS